MKFLYLSVLLLSSLCACSKQEPIVGKLDPQGAKLGIMITDWPKAVATNAEFPVEALLRNMGEQTLPAAVGEIGSPHQVYLSYHWLAMDGKPVIWDGTRASIGAALKKSEDRAAKLVVTAPPTPDNYILELDVVQEGDFWFGGIGSQTSRVVITVQ